MTECTAPSTLTLTLDGHEWPVSWLCHSKYSIWYLLNRRLGGPQSKTGHYGEEQNFLPLAKNWTPVWLSYPRSGKEKYKYDGIICNSFTITGSNDCQGFMLNSHLISLHRNSGINKAVIEIKRIFMTQNTTDPCTIKYKKKRRRRQMQCGAAPHLFFHTVQVNYTMLPIEALLM